MRRARAGHARNRVRCVLRFIKCSLRGRIVTCGRSIYLLMLGANVPWAVGLGRRTSVFNKGEVEFTVVFWVGEWGDGRGVFLAGECDFGDGM